MVVRGAPAIGVAAAYGVALEALRLSEEPSTLRQAQGERVEFSKGMEAGFKVLAASRPTAVNLFWALQRMRKVWEGVATQSPQQIAQRLLAEAHEILAEDIRINKAMGANGAALLKDGARVLTHCNAGALATAGWGTALGVFRSAVEAGKKISVIADETRPFLQGARLTAWEMVQENIPVTLITDNMAGYMMAHGEVDAVVVGTDRVAANGDVANKIGTYMVAVLAQAAQHPVLCGVPAFDHRPEHCHGGGHSHRGAFGGGGERFPRDALGGGGGKNPQSGFRRDSGRAGDRADYGKGRGIESGCARHPEVVRLRVAGPLPQGRGGKLLPSPREGWDEGIPDIS